MAEKIGIIGAGMAGITAARKLTDAGHKITVFEKSGGTGGRLSTRRTDYGNFDHGAQYITARSAPFRAMMTGLSNAGAVALWEPVGKTSDNEWHVGTPGMSGLVKPLLIGFEVKKRTRIVDITRKDDEIVCTDEDGNADRFDRVIVATPSPQAYTLLSPVDPVFGVLNTIVYMPCWTSMFAFSEPIETLPDHYRGAHTESLSWLARNSSKPQSIGIETLCAQAGAQWSKDNLEMDKAQALAAMKDALETMADQTLKPIYAEAHRWRYALVDKPFGTAYLASHDQRLFAIGDGMLGGRVEAAFESARQLCDHLRREIS
ncbi:NAD(P)/FAD-dependent oxidoreductase [Pararhizobium sp. IMCC21322]|uniref:NAD(P)/FAD-dependent oxidoreductase n=1 Tax=Pararhizobium sp. IMCC21322 TaxID=3067903 RepID=UPI002740FE00|nr:FAD-dependent oxidoreductase [Pararhizobium sp. IMCC21322]